jgi:hypothetical protein
VATDLHAPTLLKTPSFATNDPLLGAPTRTLRTRQASVETIIVGKTLQVSLDCSGNASS